MGAQGLLGDPACRRHAAGARGRRGVSRCAEAAPIRAPDELSTSGEFAAVDARAYRESAFRGKLVYFPAEVIEEYGLVGTEAHAICHCDLASIELDDEQLRIELANVFNLHDLFAGE